MTLIRTSRRRRSCLVVPGSSEKMLAKAQHLPADEIVIDLEDAVAPAEKNDRTRRIVGTAAATLAWQSPTVAVRVNAVDTPWFDDDLETVLAAAGGAIAAVVVPKVEAPETVRLVERRLAEAESRLGLPPVEIEAQIETARGLVEVERIAAASPRLAALLFGAGDFSASVGIPVATIGGSSPDYPGDQWHYARARIAVAAAAFGLDAVDTPYAAYTDEAGLLESARHARLLGFAGKWAIHPAQIGPCNRVFTPSDDEVAAARAVLDALDGGARDGLGAVGEGGTMIDEASRRAAEAVLVRSGGHHRPEETR